MQTKLELDKFYAESHDPWGYKDRLRDRDRRLRLVTVLLDHGPYEKLLDIGAGEGWLTSSYPVKTLHGFELSDVAASRFPSCVQRVLNPDYDYDIVTATGIFYHHYDWKLFMRIVMSSARKHVLVSSIAQWEHPCVNQIGKEIYRTEFAYPIEDNPTTTQRLRLFRVSG